MRIAVLGGGNGSFAAAGDLALAGHQVRMWRRDRDAVANHCAAGRTIQLKDFRGQHTAPLELVTTDIGAAVSEAELVLCPTPAFAQADIAELLAPCLTDGCELIDKGLGKQSVQLNRRIPHYRALRVP